MRVTLYSALLLGALTAAQDTVYGGDQGDIFSGEAIVDQYGSEHIGDQTGYFDAYYEQVYDNEVNGTEQVDAPAEYD
jgi:hypothetical protein